MPAGFVGVDVFFVISGYLITGLIARAVQGNGFALTTFYARRIRRLFPALFLVIASLIFAGRFVLFENEYAVLLSDSIAGVFFFSNFAMLNSEGYFADTEIRHLRHLWSLAIEEQFYLFWPFFVAFGMRRGTRTLLRILFAFTVVSFAANILVLQQIPAAAYYLSITRFWQLSIGGILAAWELREPRNQQLPIWVKHLSSIAGALVIAGAAAGLVQKSAYPGWSGLLPVAGTALLLFAGPSAVINSLLSRKPVVYVGLISYPLYLWHYPLLTMLGDLKLGWLMFDSIAAIRAFSLAAAFVLAIATFELVEKPVRRLRGTASVVISAVLLVAILPCGFSLARSYAEGHWMSAQLHRLDRVVARSTQAVGDYACSLKRDQGFEDFSPECTAAEVDPAKPTIALWGDSLVGHLIPGIEQEFGATHRIWKQITFSCSGVLGPQTSRRPGCPEINDRVFAKWQELRPNVLILGASWSSANIPLLGSTLDKLRELPTRVIVVGSAPDWEAPPAFWLRQRALRDPAGAPVPAGGLPDRLLIPELRPEHRWENMQKLESEVRAIASAHGAEYISLYEELCNPEGCLTFQPDSAVPGAINLLQFDAMHLTPQGSTLITQKLLKPAILGDKSAPRG